LLVGGLEVSLRTAGFGYPAKALIERDFDGKPWCFPNGQFAWRFFPHQIARQFHDSLAFERDKAPGTFRIFILGGSAARGEPEPLFNLGRILEAMLGDMYPDIDFEVHNAAMVAINSHVVREIAKDVAAYDPDLFIVYLGNNEVVGPFGPSTVMTSTPPVLQMIRATIAVKSTRIGQLLDPLPGMAAARDQVLKEWGGMAMFLDNQVRPDSRALEHTYHFLEKNLQDICRIARGSGARVIVSNMGVNLRNCPPFASLHREDLGESEKQQWEDIYQQGVALEARGLHGQAIERYLAAAAIDDTFADLQFRLGHSCWETGDYENARRHYRSALQNDTLRFRADAQINNVIRTAVDGRTGEGIYFADSVAAFEAASPFGVVGSELFYEHVHLNFKGNYVLARALFPLVQQLLPSTAEPQGKMLSERQVARHVAYTKFDEYTDFHTMFYSFMNKPPFTNQLYHDDSMRKMQAELEALRRSLDPRNCLDEYARAIRENPDDWRLLVKQYQLMLKLTKRDLKELEMKLRQIVLIHPYGQGYRHLGNVLFQQGRLDESETAINRALFINPVSGWALCSLADISLKRGDHTRAIRYLRQAVQVAPVGDLSVQTHVLLAELYDEEGKSGQAVKTLQKAIRIFPESQRAPAHLRLAELFYNQGKREDALAQMKTALRITPELAKDREFTAQYYLMKGNGGI